MSCSATLAAARRAWARFVVARSVVVLAASETLGEREAQTQVATRKVEILGPGKVEAVADRRNHQGT